MHAIATPMSAATLSRPNHVSRRALLAASGPRAGARRSAVIVRASEGENPIDSDSGASGCLSAAEHDSGRGGASLSRNWSANFSGSAPVSKSGSSVSTLWRHRRSRSAEAPERPTSGSG